MFPAGSMTITLNNVSQLVFDQQDLTFFSYDDVTNLNESSQWVNLTSPLFQSWMEQNAQVVTKKLIGRINGTF
jgi:hypothetical protein